MRTDFLFKVIVVFAASACLAGSAGAIGTSSTLDTEEEAFGTSSTVEGEDAVGTSSTLEDDDALGTSSTLEADEDTAGIEVTEEDANAVDATEAAAAAVEVTDEDTNAVEVTEEDAERGEDVEVTEEREAGINDPVVGGPLDTEAQREIDVEVDTRDQRRPASVGPEQRPWYEQQAPVPAEEDPGLGVDNHVEIPSPYTGPVSDSPGTSE